MKVVLAEKPSVARDIAAFLGAKKACDGYFEGNGFQVTWAFGHLVVLKEPEEYDPALKKWSLATLPILPESFQLKVLSDKGATKQFGIIKKLFLQAQEIICATDAGREGELIFRYILALSGCKKKQLFRLWLSSLTEESIQKAFAKLLPQEQYDNLFAAAKCRSESDWIVGLNATRNFTVRYGKGSLLWSVGRVQTPVLAMIVHREDEIRNFRSEPFWELKTTYRNTIFKYSLDRFMQKEEGEKKLHQSEGHPLVIEKVERKKEKVSPPLPFDLTELQREMNKKHGFSAQETLEIAQNLYEQKFISYPRTDSRFLSSDLKPELPKILERLKPFKQKEIESLNLQDLPSKLFNDKKTGEHHAIIPTGKEPSNLAAPNLKVFEAIVVKLIASLSPPCLKEVTTVEGKANEVPFHTKGVYVKEPGWTALYSKEKEEEEPPLPLFTVGESGPHTPFLKEGKTEPPRSFSEATLLSAMETAGKLVEEEDLKEALKQKGLGTPATRASIIETLLKRGYIVRDKKNLQATDLGRYLIALIPHPALKSPELTGEWECKLKKIEEGTLAASLFMQEIAAYTKDIVQESLPPLEENSWGPCPFCGKPVIEGKKGYGCSAWKEGCTFVLWKEQKSHLLSPSQVRQLLQRKFLPLPSFALYLSPKGALCEVPIPAPTPFKKRQK